MPPDDPRVEDTRSWLARAAADLRASEIDLAADPPLVEDALFHCQQAVEKAYKAFLTFHDRPFRRTHSLEELGAQCLTFDFSLGPLVHEAAPLSQYAWRYRYPGLWHTPERMEADTALELARNVDAAIRTRLPSNAQP